MNRPLQPAEFLVIHGHVKAASDARTNPELEALFSGVFGGAPGVGIHTGARQRSVRHGVQSGALALLAGALSGAAGAKLTNSPLGFWVGGALGSGLAGLAYNAYLKRAGGEPPLG